MTGRWRGVISLLAVAAGAGLAAITGPQGHAQQIPAQQEHAQQEDVRKLERDGLKLELAPLQHDAVLAFFMGRGFGAADAEFIAATACVFRSSIGSSFATPGSAQVSVDLRQWRVIAPEGTAVAPMTREDWTAIWKKRGPSEDAGIAFYWALFPSKQTFAATDYNWGMLTFGLAPGARFSLELRWRTGTKDHVQRLEALQCGTPQGG